MGAGRRNVLIAVVLAAGLVSLVSMCRRASGPSKARPPRRLWKCTKCGKEFELSYQELARLQQPGRAEVPDRPDPWSLPVIQPKGAAPSPIESVPCPACGGEAHRYIEMKCADCGKSFRHLEALVPLAPDDAKAAPRVKPPACPHCGSARVSPR
ncbi:zinc ribbon domain-containing protein [bacterium]|nr:zinc ribbon domain-containing protein [bacterium]